MRLTFDCATPTTVPTIIVAAATTQSASAQVPRSGANAEKNTRTNAANAAALTPVDMKAVTAGGAPSYASGVHMWNGTAATLKAKPTITRPTASICIGVGDAPVPDIRPAIRSSLVLPVRP